MRPRGRTDSEVIFLTNVIHGLAGVAHFIVERHNLYNA